MKYSEISADLKKFIRTLWNRANQDEFGNPYRGHVNTNANNQHHEIHIALDSLGLSRGSDRGDFLNSLND